MNDQIYESKNFNQNYLYDNKLSVKCNTSQGLIASFSHNSHSSLVTVSKKTQIK